MAEKILQTRIINKHADLATWKDSGLALKTGEIALARVETTKPDGNGGFYKVPTYLMKVGDGDKTFSQLEWLAAPASDVYEWAKASVKPSYTATEIKRGDNSSVNADLAAAEQAIQALQTLVGSDKSVATLISEAIQALDVDDAAVANQFVTAVAEADGKISVTRRALEAADIPALGMDKITGLSDALALKADKSAVKETTDAITARLDTGDIKLAIDAAKKSGDDAQKTIDDYKTANDAALAGVKATAEAATTVAEAEQIAADAVSSFKTAHFDGLATRVSDAENGITANATAIQTLKNTEVKANADAIADLEARIGSVANVMNFRGVSVKGEGTTPGHDITDPKAGDVIIYGDAEYVYDESNVWVKFGDASDNATAISDLQTRVGNVETRLNTGDIYQAIQANATAASNAQDAADAAQEYAEGVAGDLATETARAKKAEEDNLATAKSYAEEKASAAQTAAEATAKKYTDDQLKPVTEAASALATTVATNKTEAAAATKQVADDLAAYETANDARVKAIEEDYTTEAEATDIAQGLVTALANGQVKTNKEAIEAQGTRLNTIEADYARVKGNQLVYGQGDAEMVIIFDCGGAQ